jgi:molybdate transport system substrate-binding protein
MALFALPVSLSGCGSSGGGADQDLVISAASSLTEAFESYGDSRPGEERFSFAGSDELAAQIKQGATPDVFASANTTYPDELHGAGLVEKPVEFAQNELVIAVPRDGAGVSSIGDLAKPGVDVVVGAKGVPAGDYARDVLGHLPAGEREAIEANVRSEESDVKGIVAKVTQEAADAGFVYASDVAAAGAQVRAIQLPQSLRPQVTYAAAVVRGAGEPKAAEEFVDGLLRGAGASALHDAGFLPPPRS